MESRVRAVRGQGAGGDGGEEEGRRLGARGEGREEKGARPLLREDGVAGSCRDADSGTLRPLLHPRLPSLSWALSKPL